MAYTARAMDLIRLPDAARELGISYPTLKQWIYRRRIRSVKTAGGHHRIPRSEVDRVIFQKLRSAKKRAGEQSLQTGSSHSGLENVISGRNQLVGRVTALKTSGLLAKVELDIGGQKVVAIITRDACRELKLKPGDTAAALIKATEVMIIRPG